MSLQGKLTVAGTKTCSNECTRGSCHFKVKVSWVILPADVATLVPGLAPLRQGPSYRHHEIW